MTELNANREMSFQLKYSEPTLADISPLKKSTQASIACTCIFHTTEAFERNKIIQLSSESRNKDFV